jgi:hypothetical protein
VPTTAVGIQRLVVLLLRERAAIDLVPRDLDRLLEHVLLGSGPFETDAAFADDRLENTGAWVQCQA